VFGRFLGVVDCVVSMSRRNFKMIATASLPAGIE
jgi:hypothetical protein